MRMLESHCFTMLMYSYHSTTWSSPKHEQRHHFRELRIPVHRLWMDQMWMLPAVNTVIWTFFTFIWISVSVLQSYSMFKYNRNMGRAMNVSLLNNSNDFWLYWAPCRKRSVINIQIGHLYTILLSVQSCSSLSLRKYALTASAAWLLHRGAFYFKIRFLWTPWSPRSHALLYFLCHGHEGLLHVRGIFGTRLKERDAKRVCELLWRKSVFSKVNIKSVWHRNYTFHL